MTTALIARTLNPAPVERIADLSQIATEMRRLAQLEPDSIAASMTELECRRLIRSVEERYNLDAQFRGALLAGVSTEMQIDMRAARLRALETRALGATAYAQVVGSSFVPTFMGEMVNRSPLLDLSETVSTSNGARLYFSFTVSQITSNGIVTQGSTITGSDPAFDGGYLGNYGYKNLITASDDLVTDGALDIESMCANAVAPLAARKLNDDLWGGNGTTAPQGLLAGLSTVSATGAAIVTFLDIANLLAAVPAAPLSHLYTAHCNRCELSAAPVWNVRLSRNECNECHRPIHRDDLTNIPTVGRIPRPA